jgi:hypothetical protein
MICSAPSSHERMAEHSPSSYAWDVAAEPMTQIDSGSMQGQILRPLRPTQRQVEDPPKEAL